MRGKRFAAALAAARLEKGYATAYAFYRAAGGPRGLGYTFPAYMALERGASLPAPPRLRRLFPLLGLEPSSGAGRRLLEAYLADHLGGEDLVQALAGPVPADPIPESWAAAESLSREAWKRDTKFLSVDQLKVLAEDPLAYACHLLAKTSRSPVPKARLAGALGCPARKLEPVLRRLEAARLLKTKGDRVSSPYSGLLVPLPPATPATAGLLAKLGQHRALWAEDKGRPIHASYLFLRTTPEKMRTYQSHLDQAVNMAAVYLENEMKDGTALYLVEGQVSRLFD